jgi:transcriptional regulator with XRE-family HTH domain
MERLGEKLRALRKRRGLSIRQLASVLGVKAHSHIARIEMGQNKPSLELLVNMAQFFDVSYDQLLNDNLELD